MADAYPAEKKQLLITHILTLMYNHQQPWTIKAVHQSLHDESDISDISKSYVRTQMRRMQTSGIIELAGIHNNRLSSSFKEAINQQLSVEDSELSDALMWKQYQAFEQAPPAKQAMSWQETSLNSSPSDYLSR